MLEGRNRSQVLVACMKPKQLWELPQAEGAEPSPCLGSPCRCCIHLSQPCCTSAVYCWYPAALSPLLPFWGEDARSPLDRPSLSAATSDRPSLSAATSSHKSYPSKGSCPPWGLGEMISLKLEPAERLATAEVMQQIPPSCECIYISTPSTCGENPLLIPWTGRKPCLHLSALFSAGGLMVCVSCFPQQSSVSCFGAGRVGKKQNAPSLVFSPHAVSQHAVGRGTRHPPYGPAALAAFSATLRAAAEVGEGRDGTVLRDSSILRTDVYKLFIKSPSYICH